MSTSVAAPSTSPVGESRFPFPDNPEGWFHVAYAHELAVGETLPLHYFGEQLVAYRGEDGQAHVMNAYCPHQGADISIGGKVDGDCIVCPFHGWKFDPRGKNVEIPYAKSPNRLAKLKAWPTRELAGMIWVWHSSTGSEPTWDLPQIPEFDDDKFVFHVPEGARWKIRTHVQEIYENTVDVAHFAFVHGVAAFGSLQVEEEYPMFRAVAEVDFVTPRGPVNGAVDSELWGLGIDVVRHRGLGVSCTLLTATPIDGEYVDARYTFFVLKSEKTGEMGRMGLAFARDSIKQINQDIPVWENKVYRAKPLLAAGEGAVTQFRKWAQNAYVADNAEQAPAGKEPVTA